MFFPHLEQACISPFTGYHGRTVHGDRMTAVSWEIEAGAAVPMHQHENEQIGMCIEGEFSFTLGEETRVMQAGDMVVIPSMVLHGGYALTPCRFIDFFAPVRATYQAKSTT